MHRHVFGVIGLVVLLSGIGFVLYDLLVETPPPQAWIIGGGLVRAGILTLALWFAMPERADQIPWPRVGAIATAAVLVALRPKVLLFLVPFIVVGGIAAYVLRPRAKPGARGRSQTRR